MPPVYVTALKNTRMTAVRDLLDAPSGNAYLELGTAGMSVILANIVFPKPCGSVAGGVLSFLGLPITTSAAMASGIAAAATAFDGANNPIITGLTVGESGADVNLSSTNVVIGEPVTLTAASITHG